MTPTRRRRKSLDTIGHSLRQARRARGIAAKDLAEEVGVTLQYIYQLEKGLYTPSIPLLLKLADALAVRFTLTAQGKGETHVEPEVAYWNCACFVAIEED